MQNADDTARFDDPIVDCAILLDRSLKSYIHDDKFSSIGRTCFFDMVSAISKRFTE